jgi:hypothetical protein
MTTNVLNLQGDYRIKVQAGNGIVYVEGNLDVSEDAEIHGNTILGDTRTETIDPKGSFINDLIPRDGASYNIGEQSFTWNQLNIEQFTQWGDGSSNINVINNTENVGNTYPPYPGVFTGRPYSIDDIYGLPEHRQTAALYVKGGVGIEKDLNVGGFIYGRIEQANTTLSVTVTSTNVDYEFYPVFVANTGNNFVEIDKEGIVDGLRYNPSRGRISSDRVKVAELDDATSAITGALQVVGGAGIGKNLYVEEDVTAANVLPQGDDDGGSVGTSSTQWSEAYGRAIWPWAWAAKT